MKLVLRPCAAPATAPRQPRTRTQRRQFFGRKTDRKSHHREPLRNGATASQQRTARTWRREKDHQPTIGGINHRPSAYGQASAERNRSRAACPPLNKTAGTGKRGHGSNRRKPAGTCTARAESRQAPHQRRRNETRDGGQQRRIGASAATHGKRSAGGGKIRRHPDHQRRTGRGKIPRTGQRDNAGQLKHPGPPAKKTQARPAKPREPHRPITREATPL